MGMRAGIDPSADQQPCSLTQVLINNPAQVRALRSLRFLLGASLGWPCLSLGASSVWQGVGVGAPLATQKAEPPGQLRQ